jgi:polyphosphate glucokinase
MMKKTGQRGLRILVVDVGGTHVKLLATGLKRPITILSGPTMTAKAMIPKVRAVLKDCPYDVVSLGYPGPVVHGRPMREPYNLGRGWVGFDFRKAFGRPVKIINDAAMQALGSYKGGRLLFLGLGTGLGSAMIVDGVLEPMELAHLPYKRGKTYEDYLGLRGLKRLGRKKWQRQVGRVVKELRQILEAEEVVLGGGNAKKLKKLPPRTILGGNRNAFLGGFRMWSKAPEAFRQNRNAKRT